MSLDQSLVAFAREGTNRIVPLTDSFILLRF